MLFLGSVVWGCVQQPLLREGDASLARGEHAAAETTFTRIIDEPRSSDRERQDAYLGRAKARLAAGNGQDAVADANAALAIFPDAQGYYLRGRGYRQTGDWAKATEDFRWVLDAYNRKQRRQQMKGAAPAAQASPWVVSGDTDFAAQSALALGEIALGREDYRAAMDAFDIAAALAPADPLVYLKRGGAYRLMEMEDQAARELKNYRDLGGDPAIGPETVLAPLVLKEALARYAAGDYAAAVSEASKALELQPGYVGALLCRGHGHTKRSEYGQALADFTAAVQAAPEDLEPRLYRAFALTELGQYDAAEQEAAFVLEKEPENANALLQRGFAAMGGGRYTEAATAFSRILDHDGAHERALLYRGIARYQSGNLDEAEADFRALIERTPALVRAHHLLGLCRYRRHDYKGALAAINKALDLDGRNSELYHLRGILHYQSGRATPALVDLDRAVTLAPDNAKLYMSRGVVKGSLGRAEAAAADYALASKLYAQGEAKTKRATIDDTLLPEATPLQPGTAK